MEELKPQVRDVPLWFQALAWVTVALMPLSFNIGPYVLKSEKPLYLSPLDALIPFLAAWVFWDAFSHRPRWGRIPWPFLAWAAWALLSYRWVETGGQFDWLKSALLQTTLVGFVGVWVFRRLGANALHSRTLILILGVSIGLCLLYALYQYVGLPGQPLPSGQTGRYYGGGATNIRVGGWYLYRGQLAAQVAMLVPAFVALAVSDRDPAVRWPAAGMAALGLTVCLSGGGYLAASMGILAVAGALAVRSRLHAAAIVLGALVVFTLLVLPCLPRNNPAVLWRSLTLYAAVEGAPDSDEEHPTARLRRYQADLNALRNEGIRGRGAGAGQFQRTINPVYTAPYPKPGRNTDDEAAFDMDADEPMTFGLWETTAVELGLPGLALLLWVFLIWIGSAGAAWMQAGEEGKVQPVVALACLGAGAGALSFSLFGSPLLRGAGGTFALFAGLALAARASLDEPASTAPAPAPNPTPAVPH